MVICCFSMSLRVKIPPLLPFLGVVMLTVSDNHIVLGGGGGGGSTTFDGLSDKATADIPAINTPLSTALDAKEATSNKKTDVDANKTSDTFFPTVKAVFDWVSVITE